VPRKPHINLASIIRRGFTANKSVSDKPVDQTDSTVVTNLEALSEFTDGGTVASRKTFDSQQRLVMLRSDAGGESSSFTEVQKTSQGVAERCQQFVLDF
jgi:hypothetical protein